MGRSRMGIMGALAGFVVTAATVMMAQTAGQQPPAGAAPPPPPPPAVKVGEAVPDFTLPYFAPKADGSGYEPKEMKLSDYKGKQNVVLAFFPAAFSPGCTSEMQKYRDTKGQFNSANTAIFGVSVDSTWANKAFREQLGADFPILSDWKKEVSRKLGVLNEQTGFAHRTTFVIDKNGVVQQIVQGRDALDPSGVVGMCEKLHKGTGE